MKTIGIQIKSAEAIIVVLEKNAQGEIMQTNESAKFDIQDHKIADQIRQFRDQINTEFDSVKPTKIGIVARVASRGERAPSPISFKLEGIIQLYEKIDIQLISKLTLLAYFKKNQCTISPKHKYQQDAFDLAYYLMTK